MRPDGRVEDGDRIRHGMMMLDHGKAPAAPATFDAAQHMPHALQRTSVDDARTLSGRQAMINRVNDAWKHPAPEPHVAAPSAPAPVATPAPAPTADRSVADAAYDRLRRRLEDAWKTA
jgi:hypothetical protein